MIRPLYKLKKCPAGVAPGKYSASVMHDYALGTQQVVQEAIDYCGLHISPYLFESVVSGLFESMIHHTLRDGTTRRFGDYFELQLDIIRGRRSLAATMPFRSLMLTAPFYKPFAGPHPTPTASLSFSIWTCIIPY